MDPFREQGSVSSCLLVGSSGVRLLAQGHTVDDIKQTLP